MARRWKLPRGIVLCALAAGTLSACAGPADPPAPPPIVLHDEPGGAGAAIAHPSPSLLITHPASGQRIQRPAIQVAGRAVGLSTVSIDGASIPVVDGTFSTFVPARRDGPKRIEATATGVETQAVDVLVDWQPPHVEIESPSRGAMVPRGDRETIRVRGQAWDRGSGLSSVWVDGEEATVDGGGRFTLQVPISTGVHTLRVEAVDGSGHTQRRSRSVLFGDFAALDRPIENGLAVRVSGDGLAAMAPELIEAFLPGIAADFSERNPDLGFEITAMRYELLDVDVETRAGALDVRVAAARVSADFRMLDPPRIEGTIRVLDLSLNTEMRFVADGSGNLDVHTEGGKAEFEDVEIEFRGLLGLVDRFFKRALEDLVDDILTQIAEGYVLERAIEAETLVAPFSFAEELTLGTFLLTSIHTDSAGLHLGLSGDFAALNTEQVHHAPGSLSSGGSAAASVDRSMLHLGISVDLLNRGLTELWVAGALDLELGTLLRDPNGTPMEVTANTLALLVGPRIFDHVAPNDAAQIQVQPALPPVVELEPRGPGTLTLYLPALEVALRLQPETGADKLCALVSVDLVVEVTLDPDNPDAPITTVALASVDLLEEPLFDIQDALFEPLMAGFFEKLPELVDPEALLGTPAPQEGALATRGARLGTGSGNALTLFVDLWRDPAREPTPELAVLATATNPDNARTYHLLESSSWVSADRAARAMGGHLATVRNAAENHWLLETFGEARRGPRDLWIGLAEHGDEGQFAWTSGEPLEFQNWGEGQPDSHLEPNGRSYVFLHGDDSRRDQDGRWNDWADAVRAPWNRGFHGVVQMPAEP